MVKDLKLENDLVTGSIDLLFHNSINNIKITIDDESGNIKNIKQIQSIINNISNAFEDFNLDMLLLSIAKEVNEVCYEQSDYQPTESDDYELANDLKITDIHAYKKDMVIITYSPSFLPDMDISCQIIYKNKKMENLEINDK